MNDAILLVISKLRKHLAFFQPRESKIDTLTAFVRDAEHNVLSVVMALQAHIDLMHDEQKQNDLPLIRFMILNRAIARITADMVSLAAISDLMQAPSSKQKQMLDVLMREIA